jgi:phytoene dehydrogenase-like protein
VNGRIKGTEKEGQVKQDNYDVVVIGSGIGGLSAAAFLVASGYRTLVVERLPRVGGRYSTIEHKGYKITTGAIEVELGGVVEKAFDAVGAKLDVRPVPPIRYRVDGKDHELPAKGGLRTLISLACRDEGEAERVMRALKRGLTWQEPWDGISLREWLLQYTENERVLKTFWALVSPTHFVNDNELPAGKFFEYLKAPKGYGIGIAPLGNLVLMESLAKAIEARGGKVWTRCQAKQIVVADGAVKGAIIQRGDEVIEVTAKAVVSNTGPQKTVALAGSQNFGQGYLKQLGDTLRPAPFIAMHIASDEPLVDCSSLIFVLGHRLSVMNSPTLLCPEHAPEGRHLLMAGGSPRSSLPPYDLKKDKELMIQDLRENIPGFDKRAEILIASYFRGECPGYHSWPGYDMPQKTSIENLYNVGDGVKPPGWIGLGACARSAEIVVEDIKVRVKPE